MTVLRCGGKEGGGVVCEEVRYKWSGSREQNKKEGVEETKFVKESKGFESVLKTVEKKERRGKMSSCQRGVPEDLRGNR